MNTQKPLAFIISLLPLLPVTAYAKTLAIPTPLEFNVAGSFKMLAKASCKGYSNTITNTNKPFTGTLSIADKNTDGDYPFTWHDSLQSHYSTGLITPHGKSYELTWDNEYDTSGALAFLYGFQAANQPGVKHTFSATIKGSQLVITDRAYIKLKLPNGCSATYEAIKTAKSVAAQ